MSDEAELLLPFILTESLGGPYDDAAFSSGFRLGMLNSQLAYERPIGQCVTAFLGCRDLPQADLIAMSRGYVFNHIPIAVINEEGHLEHRWHRCHFVTADELPDSLG